MADGKPLSAWEHVDRIDGWVYNALYSDRHPPDPALPDQPAAHLHASMAGDPGQPGASTPSRPAGTRRLSDLVDGA
jgi:hypothetical protein